MLSPACVQGPGHGHPSSTSEKREGEPSGRKENQLTPNSWPLSEPGPRMEDCWCQGWGWSQQKAETLSGLPPKKNQKSRGPGPSCPSPQYEKVQNIITKWGLRGALSLSS